MSLSMTLATSPNVIARLFAGQYHRVMAFSIRLCPDVVFVAQTFGASSTKHVVQLTVGRLIVYKRLFLGIFTLVGDVLCKTSWLAATAELKQWPVHTLFFDIIAAEMHRFYCSLHVQIRLHSDNTFLMNLILLAQLSTWHYRTALIQYAQNILGKVRSSRRFSNTGNTILIT